MDVDGADEHKTGAGGVGRSSRATVGERQIRLHPLAIISISDHFTRVSVGGSRQDANSRIFGLLFGTQSLDGLSLSIHDAVECGCERGSGGKVVVNPAVVTKENELLTAVYPSYRLLGWYSVGAEANADDASVHLQMTHLMAQLQLQQPIATSTSTSSSQGNPSGASSAEGSSSSSAPVSPLFLLLNPRGATSGAKELPVAVLESTAAAGAAQARQLRFSPLSFSLDTAQPEQISVEHVVKATPNAGVSQIDLHASATCTSLRGLTDRLSVLSRFVRAAEQQAKAAQAGGAPGAGPEAGDSHRLLRQIAGLAGQLPTMEAGSAAESGLLAEYSDSLAVSYLAAVQKGAAQLADAVDKFSVAHGDRHRRAM